MPDIPPAAIAAAESAIRDAFPGEFGKPGMPEPDALARAALEAAAPLLAEAWGVTGNEREARKRRAAELCRPLMECSTEDLRDALIVIGAAKRKRLRAALGIPEVPREP